MALIRRNPNVYGDIPGYPVGTTFKNRQECSNAGVHAPVFAGIHGKETEPAYSIVLSGGYEDDFDMGNQIIYTGQGKGVNEVTGKAARGGPQVGDQEWVGVNRSLQLSVGRYPVRVIRGHQPDSPFAPAKGYRYDGLFNVVRAWKAKGEAGYMMCKFELEPFDNTAIISNPVDPIARPALVDIAPLANERISWAEKRRSIEGHKKLAGLPSIRKLRPDTTSSND